MIKFYSEIVVSTVYLCVSMSFAGVFLSYRSGFPPSQDIRDDLQIRRSSQIHTGLVPALR